MSKKQWILFAIGLVYCVAMNCLCIMKSIELTEMNHTANRLEMEVYQIKIMTELIAASVVEAGQSIDNNNKKEVK